MFLEAKIINNVTHVVQAIEEMFEAKTIENKTVIVGINEAWNAWSNYYQLYTSASEEVVDEDGNYVFAKKSDSDMGDSYKSAYTGSEIDEFVSEVLK